MNGAHHVEDKAGAPGKGAEIVSPACTGRLPSATDTVKSHALCMLLNGERITGMDAVLAASTTRLAAAIQSLEGDFAWPIERADKAVACADGRTAHVREYWLSASVIAAARKAGAGEWIKQVRAARAALRSQAAEARARAEKVNAARRPAGGVARDAQADLFAPGQE